MALLEIMGVACDSSSQRAPCLPALLAAGGKCHADVRAGGINRAAVCGIQEGTTRKLTIPVPSRRENGHASIPRVLADRLLVFVNRAGIKRGNRQTADLGNLRFSKGVQ